MMGPWVRVPAGSQSRFLKPAFFMLLSAVNLSIKDRSTYLRALMFQSVFKSPIELLKLKSSMQGTMTNEPEDGIIKDMEIASALPCKIL